MSIQFRKTTFWGVASDIASCPPSDRPEIVFSGKSNVGKSSLINALADNKKLARVSATPGKTRVVVYFNVDDKLYFADLPGYGYAKAAKDVKEKFNKLCDQYFVSGRKFSLVLHLLDVRHAPSADDIRMLDYMNQSGIPYFLVFTKCDKLSKAQIRKQLNEFSKILDFHEDARIFAVSSEKKVGLDDLRAAIEEYLQDELNG
ncbi:MAG: YihA family ribosome biogenesis GTP-binding protein [Clostridiales bacterium]|nr:YihA family ribosome biogenesis GTP-binding protein [Clostridiales bacterium]MBR5417654.1 YihA family ribosome biogenesis GTP-binding protein [Clostridiales bacterium]